MSTDSGLLIDRPAGWVRTLAPRGDEDAADEARGERAANRLRARLAARQELLALLGLFHQNTTILSVLGGGTLGPAIGPRGGVLRWSYWSPKRKVLLDVFSRVMPPDDELEARQRFADAHGLRYGVVPPDKRLTLASLKEWLDR